MVPDDRKKEAASCWSAVLDFSLLPLCRTSVSNQVDVFLVFSSKDVCFTLFLKEHLPERGFCILAPSCPATITILQFALQAVSADHFPSTDGTILHVCQRKGKKKLSQLM